VISVFFPHYTLSLCFFSKNYHNSIECSLIYYNIEFTIRKSHFRSIHFEAYISVNVYSLQKCISTFNIDPFCFIILLHIFYHDCRYINIRYILFHLTIFLCVKLLYSHLHTSLHSTLPGLALQPFNNIT
jgi:hypothetical protein